jgi:Holliday junction resolvasome RuvABC DNA-binding subunit
LEEIIALELFGAQDKERGRFAADVANQRNELMNKLAGASVTDNEAARVLEGVPTRRDAGDSFQGKAQSTTDQMFSKAESEIMALEAVGYDTSLLRQNLNRAKRAALAARDQEIQGQNRNIDLVPTANASPNVGEQIKVVDGVPYRRSSSGKGWERM